MKRIISLLLLLTVAISCFAGCEIEKKLQPIEFVVKQIENKQQIEVEWEDPSYMIVDVTVKHGDQIVAKTSVEGQSAQRVTLDVYYGKHQVLVEAKKQEKGEFVKFAEGTKEVALSTDEYIIAPISGSMPQLYFTLNMKEITKDYTIPSFVWLARPDSWNWDKLPENVYAMPNVDKAEVLTHNNYDKMVQYTDAYIEELFSINSSSKFNLYINDYNSYLYMKLLAGNGIPEDNYYVTLLSDGGASYADFNAAFNSEDETFDADVKYTEMSSNLKKLYDEVREAKDYNDGEFTVDTDTFRQYAYVAAKEKNNVEWWILRPREGVLCSPDKEFITTVLTTDKTEGIIEERNFAAPLKEMTDEQKAELKSLYNFNNEIFEAADKQNKKAMMILGSWANPENEPDFEAYTRFTKLYYGDQFVYYYKGHPNTPTDNYPDKQAQLNELELIDVESSINAELILFFYPDIYMCGYNSSTFMSVEKPEMACAMYNMKKDACTGEYKDLIGIYLTKIDVNASEYASLCTEADHTYFLMEYNDGSGMIGIYDDNAGTIKNYKAENGTFTEISK